MLVVALNSEEVKFHYVPINARELVLPRGGLDSANLFYVIEWLGN